MDMRRILSAVVILVVAAGPSDAAVKISLDRSANLESDPGNEITQSDLTAEVTHSIYQSSDQRQNYSAGLSLRATRLDFDEPVLGKVDLLKVSLPISGLHVHSGRLLFNWSVSPGMHGDRDHFSDADFRVDGQFTAIMPRGKRQWVVGAGVGEEFGKVRVFPVLGAVWMLSDRSTLTTLFPLLKYEYSAGNRRKYVAEFAPSGAEWTWEPGAIGNAEAGDLILQGLRISGGGEFGISEAATAFANVGVVVARKAKVAQQANPSNNASIDLKPAWFVEVGISFP